MLWFAPTKYDQSLTLQNQVDTLKVLLNALTHGFVQMSKISLLVFDEGQLYSIHVCCIMLIK